MGAHRTAKAAQVSVSRSYHSECRAYTIMSCVPFKHAERDGNARGAKIESMAIERSGWMCSASDDDPQKLYAIICKIEFYASSDGTTTSRFHSLQLLNQNGYLPFFRHALFCTMLAGVALFLFRFIFPLLQSLFCIRPIISMLRKSSLLLPISIVFDVCMSVTSFSPYTDDSSGTVKRKCRRGHSIAIISSI